MSNENISGGGGEFGVQFSKVLDLREASVDPPTPPDRVWSSDAGRAAACRRCRSNVFRVLQKRSGKEVAGCSWTTLLTGGAPPLLPADGLPLRREAVM